jgi:hypothetical protein
MAEEYKPGDEAKRSGIYRVVHDPNHSSEHEVTCVHGKKFPRCNHCGHHVRFGGSAGSPTIDSVCGIGGDAADVGDLALSCIMTAYTRYENRCMECTWQACLFANCGAIGKFFFDTVK